MPYESYRGVSDHRPFTTFEKGVMFAVTTLVSGPLAIMSGGSRAAFFLWKLRPLTIPFLFGSISPGGGGPGQSLISTATPPSVTEVGRMITQGGHPMKGGRPDSSKASQGRSRKRCPPGYRWNGARCVRKD